MTKNANKGEGADRRRANRMAVVDTFSLFAVVPAKGPHRLKLNDMSDAGLGFDLDIEEEEGSGGFDVEIGTPLEIHLYMNQSLYLPLSVQIRRIVQKNGVRQIGAELTSRSSKGYLALIAFLDMLDALGEGAQVVKA